MPENEADEFREAAQSGALICPVPGCSAPRLTARACTSRRDHFMHVHAPTDSKHKSNYWKVAARRLLCEWVDSQDQVVELVENVEVDEVPITVLATLSDENQVALCYVEKKLGADKWEEHNYTLRSSGLGVAWVFALNETYFALPEPADQVDQERTDLILDQPIYRRMRGRGSWPLLLNAEQRKFGNVFKPRGKPAGRLGVPPPVSNRVQHVLAHELADCRLCRYGIATPAIKEYTLEKTSESWHRRPSSKPPHPQWRRPRRRM